MPIRVDRSSPVPLYFQVAQHLEQMIESGELPMGTRLDNEGDLAGQLGLSKPTMRRAIEYLVGRGLLVRKRGIGTQVVHAKLTREVLESAGVRADSIHDSGLCTRCDGSIFHSYRRDGRSAGRNLAVVAQ